MRRQLLLLALALWVIPSASAQPTGWDEIEKTFGRNGIVQGDLLKVTFPRTDVAVKMGTIPVEPGLALTSWIGFKRMGGRTMMMGDLALLENEVAPVTAKLVAEGIRLTALHNHLLGSSPTIMYLHFDGEGKPEVLARAMRAVLAATATPIETPPSSASPAPPPDWSKVEAILGKTGVKRGNLLQLSFPRKETITENGMTIPPFLGMASGINLQMVGAKAATTGDFVLIGSEVNPVVKELTDHGITVTAVHSHMLFESPRLFFLHYWGYDEPAKLANALKAALARIDLAR